MTETVKLRESYHKKCKKQTPKTETKQLNIQLQAQKQLIKFCEFTQIFQCKICYEVYNFDNNQPQRIPLIICENNNIQHQMCSSCWAKHDNNCCPFCRKQITYQPFPNQNLKKLIELTQALNLDIFSINFGVLLKNIEPILRICRQNTGEIIKFCWKQSRQQEKVQLLKAQIMHLKKEINITQIVKGQLRNSIETLTKQLKEKDQGILELNQKLILFKQNQQLMINHCQELVLKVQTSLANINIQSIFENQQLQKQTNQAKYKSQSQKNNNVKENKKYYKQTSNSHNRRKSNQSKQCLNLNNKKSAIFQRTNDQDQIHKKSKKEIQQLKRILLQQKQTQHKLSFA